MIGYINGKVISGSDNKILIENNGIGYEVICSAAAACRLLQERAGGVYTYLQVKEDGISLFGFNTPEEKAMFLKLLSVSGVGAKMAITVLSGLGIKDLAVAIASSDVKELSKIKGLGKKTAERIIVELRESVSGIAGGDLTSSGGGSASIFGSAINSDGENAVTALMTLGYTRAVASKAVTESIEGGAQTLEDIIANALRSLG